MALAPAAPNGAEVPADGRRSKPFAETNAADPQRSIQVRFRVHQTFEGHALSHQPLGLPIGAGADDHDARAERLNRGMHLTQLREEVQTRDSAVVTNRDDKQRSLQKCSKLDVRSRRGAQRDRRENTANHLARPIPARYRARRPT